MDRTATFYAQPTYSQRGGGLPVYSGSRRQRGGSVLGAIKAFIMPFLSNVKNRVIHHAKTEGTKFAKGVVMDAFRGRNVAQSVKTRAIQGAKQLGKNAVLETARAFTTSRKRKATGRKPKRPLKKKRRINNF